MRNETSPAWKLWPVKATRARYRVVAFTVALAAVTYFDRVCISTLAPFIMRDLGLNRLEMSFVFSAFTLSYAAFEIPTARWGQKVGTRRVLARIVAWWSAFTIATGLSNSYRTLLAVRFLCGAGEAGAWPNATRTFSRWIPMAERGKVQGIFFAGAHVWTIAWYLWFRDEPVDHPAVNAAERELILAGRDAGAGAHESGGWHAMKNPSVWALCLAYFSNTYGFYFLITWMPSYLETQRGFSAGALSLFAGLPLLLSVVADLTGGFSTDALARRFGLRFGRAAIGVTAYALAAASMLIAIWTASPVISSLSISVAAAASMFTLAASWAACIDIGGKASGVVSAAMNTTGQIGGILSPIVVGVLVERFANWSLPLYVMAVLYAFSSVCWLFVDPRPRTG